MFRARTTIFSLFFLLISGGASVFGQDPAQPPSPPGPVTVPKVKTRTQVQTPQPATTPAPMQSVAPDVREQTPRPARPTPAPRARTPEPPEPNAQSGPVTAKLERGGKVSISGPLGSVKIIGREG